MNPDPGVVVAAVERELGIGREGARGVVAVVAAHLADAVALPPCASWWGHRFRPRYERVPPEMTPELAAVLADYCIALDDVEMVRALTREVYVCDVCARCGAVVRRRA